MERKTIRRWLACLLLAALSFIPAPGWAAVQPGQVRLETAPGWGGEYKGDFVPVRVKITNRGAAVSGKVTVRLPQNFSGGVKPRAFPAIPVELPPGAEKQVTLVLSKHLARPDAQVAFVSDGQEVANAPVGGKRLSTVDKVVGVLSEDPQAASRLAELIAPAGSRIRAVPVKVSEIPENGRALSGMDVLVIHRLRQEALAAAQAEAVRQWVHAGGALLVNGMGGRDAFRGLEAILPALPESGTVKVSDLSGLAVWGKPPAGPLLSAKSRPAGSGEILAEGNGAVLLAKRTYGTGKVVLAGFDPIDPALTGWEGNRKLWEELVLPGGRVKHMDPDSMTVFGEIWMMSQALSQMPNLKLPAVGLLTVVFLVYAVVVGPVSFWLLTRAKKREWSWLLVPAAGLLMSGGLYVYGTQLRGNAVLVHQLGFVEPADGKEAPVRGMAAVLSQDAGDYDVTLKGVFAWPLELDHMMPGTDLTVKEVAVGRDTRIRFHGIPQWSKRELYLEHMADLGGNLEGTAVLSGDEWTGEVANHTRYKVRKTTVKIAGTPVAVGDLAPGETRKFRIKRPGSPGSLMPESFGYRYDSREFQLISQLYTQNPPTRLEGTDVIGWIDAPLSEVEVKDYPVKPAGLFLINGKMRIAADERGRVVMPFGAAVPEVVHADGPVMEDRMNGSLFMEQGGKVILEYRLDLPDSAEISKVRVDRFVVEGFLYDWKAKKWVPANRVENYPAASLVSRRQVRVLLEVPTGKAQQIEQPLIQVEGSVKP